MYEGGNDAIVLMMLHLLSTAWYDLRNIKDGLDRRPTALALRITERARQKLRPVHRRITGEIDAMDDLLRNVNQRGRRGQGPALRPSRRQRTESLARARGAGGEPA